MLPSLNNSSILVICTWLWSQLIRAVNGATITTAAYSTSSPLYSTSGPDSLSKDPSDESQTQAPYVPVAPTPLGTGRQGTQEYLAGFLICLMLNIAIIMVAFLFLCYLGKLSKRGRDEMDSSQPREALPWKQVLSPMADKVFRKS